MKICFLRNRGHTVGDKFTKLRKIVFLWNILEQNFENFLTKHVKIRLLGGRLGTLN